MATLMFIAAWMACSLLAYLMHRAAIVRMHGRHMWNSYARRMFAPLCLFGPISLAATAFICFGEWHNGDYTR